MSFKFKSLTCSMFLAILTIGIAIRGFFEIASEVQTTKTISFLIIAALITALLFWASISETKKEQPSSVTTL